MLNNEESAGYISSPGDRVMKYALTNLCVALLLFLGIGTVIAEELHEPDAIEEEHGPVNPYRESGIPINSQQADSMAGKIRDAMVKRGDLAASWSHVKVSVTRQRLYQSEREWMVVFNNPAEANPDHKNLYISLDPYGDVVDVNFTGK